MQTARLSPQLQKKVENVVTFVRDWKCKHTTSTIRDYRVLGAFLLENVGLSRHEETYGLHIVEHAAELLGCSAGHLYGLMRFARRINARELNALMQLKTSNDECLAFGHIRILIILKQADLRMQYAKAAIANNWTAADLHHEIKKIRRARRTTVIDTGHKNVSLSRLLDRIIMAISTYEDRLDSIWNDRTQKLKIKIADKDISKDVLDKLKDVKKVLNTVTCKAINVDEHVDKLITYAAAEIKAQV